MPVGLLELTLAGGGVAGGYALGSRLRQEVHDAAAKLGIDSANDEQQQTQQVGGLQVLKDSVDSDDDACWRTFRGKKSFLSSNMQR